MAKLLPHLIDRLHWGNLKAFGRKQIEGNRRRASRFVLDEAASRHLGDIVRNTDELMVRAFQFALPPYPVTYVELNARAFHDGMNRPLFMGASDQDERVGYLIIQDDAGGLTVHVMADTMNSPAMASSFIYRWSENGVRSITFPSQLDVREPVLSKRRVGNKVIVYSGDRVMVEFEDTPIPGSDRVVNAEIPANEYIAGFGSSYRRPSLDFAKLVIMLGSTLSSVDLQEGVDALAYLDQTWGILPAYDIPKVYERPNLFLSSSGDLRTILALLLVLNQPKHTRFTPIARSAGMYRNKRVVYAAHNTVEITLGETKLYPRLWDARPTDRVSPRRHTVRGHFRHYHVDNNCTHEWPLFPSTETGRPSWMCKNCGGYRTWVENHERGDATRGYVTKDYTIH